MQHVTTVNFRINRSFSFIAAQKDLLPVAAILAAVFFWGGSFAAMRVSVKVLNPWSVMWIRMALALVLLVPFAKKLKPADYRKGDWKLLVPMVLFLPCLYFFFESNALCYTTSSQAGIISASVPLLVAIGAWALLSESITITTIAGLLIAVGGVACLTLLNNPAGTAENPLLGNILEFLAMASAAVNMIIVKRLSSRYNPWTLTAMQTLAGTLFFTPGLYFLIQQDNIPWTGNLLVSLLFLGVFVTLGAFGLYNWGMSRMSASKASAFINLVPVTAVIIGWIMLGESLTFPQCMAASAVIGGVWLSQKPGLLRRVLTAKSA